MREKVNSPVASWCCGAILAVFGACLFSETSLANELASASTSAFGTTATTTDYIEGSKSFVVGFVNWIGSLDQTMLIRTIGFTFAAASIVSNWNALGEVRESIVSCVRPISFKGLGIGKSDDFIAPMRALFFTFALYVFYEVVSQFQNLFGDPSSTQFAVDAAIQLVLFSILAFQILRIRNMAASRFEEESKKLKKFQKTFDKALAEHNIRMTDLVRGALILPLASSLPRAYELLA